LEREKRVAMSWLFVLLILLAGCTRVSKSDRIAITYQTIETLPEQQAIHRRIVSEFEAVHPKIHVDVVYDTSKFQKLNVQLAGGAAPDVFYFIVDRLPALARRGVVMDLTEMLASHETEFFPQTVEPCRLDGRLMLMPFHFSTDVLFFNRDWLEQAGEAAPDETWDWQKFAEAAARLARAHGLTYATVLPRPLLLVQSFGGEIFTSERCVINSAPSGAALEFYRGLVENHIAPTAASTSEMEAFDGVNLFRNQKIALLVGRTYMLSEFDREMNFRWDVAPVPKGTRRWSRLSVGGNCVWRGTRHPREAREFVRFYSLEGAKFATANRNAIPASRAVAEQANFPVVLLEALKYSRLDNPWGYTFWDEFNQRVFTETAEAVALGRSSPAAGLAAIEKAGNAFLAQQ
jgi:multiple sugar transport system substrate-binding protein